MGNQLIKGYSIQGQPQSSIGNHKSWKLYKGKKQGSNLPVSIFIIQKKQLKSDKQKCLKAAKKQAVNLAKIRHPGVLALVQPLIQDQNIVAFVAQRVQGNITSLVRTGKLSEFINSELQLKMNLLPLLQTVSFLHENVRLCHLGISFDNIFMTSQGKWKLSGMSYSQTLPQQDFGTAQNTFVDYMHCSPQLVNQKKFNDKSDSFSVGILIINLLKAIKKQYKFQITAKDRGQYQRNMANLKNLAQTQILTKSQKPEQLFKVLAQLLNPNSKNRLKMSQIGLSQWINDKAVLTVKYLQKICNYEVKQQLQFLKGLAGVIQDFDSRILIKRILPILMDLLKFSQLIASIIFITIDIIKKNLVSVQNFKSVVWPSLKSVTQGKQMTAQSLYLLVSNMIIIQKYVGETEFFNCIVPLYLKCFDCPPKLKILALRGLDRMSKKYDYQFTKSKIIPKLANILKDQNLDIRKDALRALYAIIGSIDAQTISSVILTGLQNSRKAGADNFVNSITVEIYNKMIKNLSSQVLGSRIIPAILPYLTDASIKQSQFSMYKNTLFRMIQKIQAERKKTWTDENSQIGQKFSQKDFIFCKQQQIKKQRVQLANYSFLNQYTQQKKPVEFIFQQTENVQQIKPSQSREIKQAISQNKNEFTFQQPKIQNKVQFDFQSSFKPVMIKKTNQNQKKMHQLHLDPFKKSSSDYKPPEDEFDFGQTQVKYQPINQSALNKPLQIKQLPFSPQSSFYKMEQISKPVQKNIQRPILQGQRPKPLQKRQQEPQIKQLIKNQPAKSTFVQNSTINSFGQKKLSQAKLESPKKLVGPKIKKPNNVNPYAAEFASEQIQKKDVPFQTNTKPAYSNIVQYNFAQESNPKYSLNVNSNGSDFNWAGNAVQNKHVNEQQVWKLPNLNNIQSVKTAPIHGMNFGFQSKVVEDDPFAQVDRQYGMTVNTNTISTNVAPINANNFSSSTLKGQPQNSSPFDDLI